MLILNWDGATANVDWVTIDNVIMPGDAPKLELANFVRPGASGGGVFWQGYHIANTLSQVTVCDRRTGAVLRQYSVAILDSPAVLSDGLVYFGSYDGHLYALDSQTRQERWKFKTAGPIVSSPVIAAGIVYFGSNDSKLYTIELQGRCPCFRPGDKGRIFALSHGKPLPTSLI